MPSTTFTYTGGYQYWTVPAGVGSVTLTIKGAGSAGRAGGLVTGKRSVIPGRKLTIICGQVGLVNSGSTGGAAGWGAGGAGGNGKTSKLGGDGGGGYSGVRMDSSTGGIAGIAGGAGGTSGDGGLGGTGGGATGASGGTGTGSGAGLIGNATGGQQVAGGTKGTSSRGVDYNGFDGSDTQVSRAGAGGSGPATGEGGGGGGGGYYSGGGGAAAATGYAPGGGGGGGSSYTGGLSGATNVQGGGNTGAGTVVVTWVTPPPADQPPNPPTNIRINAVAESPDMGTRATSFVDVTASPGAQNYENSVRLYINVSTTSSFNTWVTVRSGYFDKDNSTGDLADLTYRVGSLAQDTHYYLRIYNEDNHGRKSTSYNAVDFWTNRAPNPPTLTAPADNATFTTLSPVTFSWTKSDPDDSLGDAMTAWRLRYRVAASASTSAGPWTTLTASSSSGTYTYGPGTFSGNSFIEWTVQTQDTGGLWGEWALTRSIYVSSLSTPPIPKTPINATPVDAHKAYPFTWTFVDPDPGDAQKRADIRYRVKGQDDAQWVTLLGELAPGVPGAATTWSIPAETFAAGYSYEWQVRTYATIGAAAASDWSLSGTFQAIESPGALATVPSVIDENVIQGALGCGTYRVFAYRQGGQVLAGEIDPLSSVQFTRVRDDISSALITTNGFGTDCCAMLADLHCWLNELVIFRDGVRVWEGPITRIAYSTGSVQIEAKDCMAYLYRRILRQGYDDSYRTQRGPDSDPKHRLVIPTPTVVQRAALLIINALANQDPNVLPYLTTFQFPDDAEESRIIPDYSQTVWEQVDSLAATAGLDYTTIGRRIILWDTHRSIGRLPEMTDGDFSDPPVVTEYGMQLCNYMAVTNNSGIWGSATPVHQTAPFQAYGPIEMVASAYSDSVAASDSVLTSAAKDKLVANLQSQARRNINNRWPTPVIVRVPDNSTLSPDINVGFDQLVPGVWIPLRSASTCRTVEQWQKLDSVTVLFEGGDEQVQVVMSPAPNGGEDDPDATNTEEA